MLFALRVTRALAGSAFLLLAAPAAHALTVTASSVTPAGPVPLGTILTVTATLFNDTAAFTQLDAAPGDALAGWQCGSPTGGTYAILANDPLLVGNATPNAASITFSGANSQWVQWQFTATRTGTVSFSVLAYDDCAFAFEGCDANRLKFIGPGPTAIFAAGPGTCMAATVQITSPLVGHVTALPTFGRPAGAVFPEDLIVVNMSLTNTGGDLTVNGVVAGTAMFESNAIVKAGVKPSTPFTILGGNQQTLIWSFSVAGDAAPGQHVRFYADTERTLAYAATLYVAAAPITIAATLYVDPDGAGILDTVPAGISYATVNDEVWIVADITNTGAGGYTVVVDPVVTGSDQDFSAPGSDFKQVGLRSPAGPVTLTPFTSTRFIWKYALDRADYYQTCLGCGGSFADMVYTIKARGVVTVLTQPVQQQNIAATLAIPTVVQLGQTFSATLWLANTADRPATFDTSVHPLLNLGSQLYANKISGPIAPGSLTVAAGQAAGFVFTLSASGIGSQGATAGINIDPYPPTFDYLGALGVSGLPIATQFEVVGPSPFVPTFSTSTTFVNSFTQRNTPPNAPYPSYQLTLAVFNSSTCDSVLEHVTVNDNTADLTQTNIGPSYFTTSWFTCSACPTGLPVTVPAGATVYFTATVQGSSGYGDLDWTGTMSGTWGPTCGLLPFSRPYTSNKVHVRQAADLTNQDSVHPFLLQPSALETKNFQVVLRVIPAGENPVDNFAVEITPHLTAGAAISLVSAPIIPSSIAGCGVGVPNICPAAAQSYTWTFKADAKGTGTGDVWFTFTVSGTDRYDGTPAGIDPYAPYPVLSYSNTGKFKILKTSVLTTSVWTEEEQGVGTECRINVILDALVDGDTDMTLTVSGSVLEPVFGVPTRQPRATWTSGNGGLVTPGAAPNLPDPVIYRALLNHGTVNAPGENFFTWTYTPEQNGAGDLRFSVSLTAYDMAVWIPQTSTATTAETWPLANGTITASLWIDRSVATTAVNQDFYVILRIRNTGDVPSAPAFSVTLTAIAGGCGGGCVGVPVKWPMLDQFTDASTTLFGCGDMLNYVWQFTTTRSGEGCVAFTASITGMIGGVPLTATALSTCLTIFPRPPAQARLLSATPTSVLPGKDFDVAVELRNDGATAVTVLRQPLLLAFSTPDFSYLAPASPPAITLGALGGTATFSAKVHVLDSAAIAPGTVGFAAAPFVATDVSTKGSVPVDTFGQLTVTVIPPEARIELQENPWHPLKGLLPIRYISPAGGKTLVKIYNLEGSLVATLVDEEKAPGDYLVQWDGKNEAGQVIAAGIYLVRFETKGLSTTKKLAVVK